MEYLDKYLDKESGISKWISRIDGEGEVMRVVVVVVREDVSGEREGGRGSCGVWLGLELGACRRASNKAHRKY